jgi:hypothetical protein
MRLKSYLANTVEDAIAMARQEWEPDAKLVKGRKASPETRHPERNQRPDAVGGVENWGDRMQCRT